MERIAIPAAFLLTAVVFWMLPGSRRMAFLAITFSLLLLWLDPVPVAIMLAMSATAYGCLRLAAGRPALASPSSFLLLIGGVASYLVIVKYLPGLATLVAPSHAASPLIVPIGLSYLTFRLIHYAVEMRNGRLPAHSFAEFMAYVAFLPFFTAGPIERFDRFLSERVHALSKSDVRQGGMRIVFGMIKAFTLPALILSVTPFETLPEAADSLLDPSLSPAAGAVWLVLAVTTVSFYLNFAGYSDIALGSARLVGFRIVENFNNPFVSTSIVEFWRRWHISLGDWARTYVFFPVSRLVQSATIGALLSFAAIGLWHAGTLHWLAYGLWHGFGVIVANGFSKRGWCLSRQPYVAAALGWVLTTGFVTLSAVFPLLSGKASIAEAFILLAAAFGVRL